MNFKKNGGFTLVELIVVIAIMAILAGVAVPVYSGYIAKAEKAGDLQLLGAVNSAFGAACVENNVAPTDLADGSVDFDIANMAPTKYAEQFAIYFAGNSGPFKVIEDLKFEGGVFKDVNDVVNTKYPQGAGMTDGEIDAAKGKYDNSNFYGKVDELAGSVDNLAGMLADKVGAQGAEGLLKDHMDALGEGEYQAFMDKYGLTEDSSDAEIANATVMYVADKLSGTTSADITETFKNGGAEAVVGQYGSIPTAAMMYGLMTGYANSEFGTNYTLTEPTGVNEVLGQFANLYATDTKFQEYFNNTTGKGGSADMDGFFAAMDVVNNYEGNFDLTDENLFVSDETNALLESLLGTNTQSE